MWLIILFYCHQIVALAPKPPQPSLWDPILDWPMVQLDKTAATIESISSSISSSIAPSISCDARIQSCPSCNGTTIQDDSGRPFQTLCQIEVRSSQSNTQLILSSAAACMNACQGNCLAATYIWEGICYLAIGGDLLFQDRMNGYAVTSYLRLGPLGLPIQLNISTSASLSVSQPSLSSIPSGSFPVSTGLSIPSPSITLSSLRTSGSMAGSQLPPLYSSPISRPSTSLGLSSSALPIATPTECSLTDLPCPDCDLENIVDARNQRYSVLCQSKLLSSDGFAYAEPLSLDACLSECDARGLNCIGVTFDAGACVIALGQMYGRFEDTNQVAFIPLINRTGNMITASVSPPPQPTRLSQFPTGGFTFESIKNSLARATSSRPAPTPSTSHCGLDLVTCPSCNGVSLDSQAGNPYEMTCNVGLKCWKSVSAWNVKTIGDCMARCDQNHLCVGGYYQFLGLQSCFLCESGTYGTHALAGYTAFSRQHLPWKPMPWIPPPVSLKLATTTSTASVLVPSSARGFWVSLPSFPALPWPNLGTPRAHA